MAEAVRLGSRVIVLKARPARVQGSIDVARLLPQPRSVEDSAVLELASRLKAGLDDTAQMEVPGGIARSASPGADEEHHRDLTGRLDGTTDQLGSGL
jgi:hypothetical protein